MKNKFFIQDSVVNKITYYHIVVFLIALPFDRFYSEVTLISLAVHSIINFDISKMRKVKPGLFLLLIAVYLITLLTTVYSVDKSQAFKDWEKQLSIFLFPLIFLFNSIDLKKYKDNLLWFFSISCVITITYLYIEAFRSIQINNLTTASIFTKPFINHNFSAPIGTHATYLSLYVSLSLVYFILKILEGDFLWKKMFSIISALILGLGLVQLSSKAVLISTLIILNICIPYINTQKSLRWKLLLTSLGITFIFLMISLKIDSFRDRYYFQLKNDVVQQYEKDEFMEPRIVRWRVALNLVKKSPVLGYGAGSELKLLKNEYYNNKLYNSYINELNAHNQYLSFLIKTGVVGLLLYLYVLGFGFVMAFKTKDVVFLGFIISLFVVSASENILDTNKGIFYFSFFLTFFCYCAADLKRPTNLL